LWTRAFAEDDCIETIAAAPVVRDPLHDGLSLLPPKIFIVDEDLPSYDPASLGFPIRKESVAGEQARSA
jgi:hypothetical protein